MPQGRHRGGHRAPFFFLAPLLHFSFSLELFVAPVGFLQRFLGELRRAAATTLLRRSAAAAPSIRRHGATRVHGTLSAAAVAAVSWFFFAVSSLVVFFFFLLINGPSERFLGGLLYDGG